jgi:8-amino-7-oxononanoate synthase
LSAVAQKGDTILYDYLSHASLREGIRLSFASSYGFAHNDLDDLEKKLKKASGNIFIVTESLFSMDGDTCPLVELVMLSKKYRAHLIIDEAHATGVIGEYGEGLVQHLKLERDVFCRIHTFGKALGCHGAAVIGSDRLKSYLINFARSFIFTTSLPEHAVAAIKCSYDLFPQMIAERYHLQNLINIFNNASIRYERINSHTAIQGVIVPGNDEVKALSAKIESYGIDIRPILYPTVPKRERAFKNYPARF